MARLTELEKVLRRDDRGIIRDTLLAQLRGGETQIKQHLAGCRSEKSQQDTKLVLQACHDTAEVIATLWGRYHS
ncbi:EscE/YscE/SsaE family type III secretion system needle protein co-chaperone [Rouxiella badensis]|jgi:type III secretion system YseE family protein|uniref:EscE/YscE/SsaE family type III secretion system needle protein co-chaperone n=1 Tax=Rouxiella badensis TaxID=1646377 RepID=UPI000370B5D6|nr:EscE/YscE/SsaE family type III secretion system needle protein co-chaperone [Rouxiella badensis]MCC3703306.1 EscE/YscE/SsaE family type III secretion system needle protein co-chaperone [Rouxiella badensis]MCC3718245.1 EscE/YscE/SsaE family type III secretion system needle protein co-chaperone [Rouxiella badensis]MCC3726987.1 EscE/YscE/SsaE family type III secretion system needle protein co-chaperone [Rouxiella badensis]MCC3731729.1 EscE/YscE/SsaE family type III secretion system needle prote